MFLFLVAVLLSVDIGPHKIRICFYACCYRLMSAPDYTQNPPCLYVLLYRLILRGDAGPAMLLGGYVAYTYMRNKEQS
jgi:hypothetical protein